MATPEPTPTATRPPPADPSPTLVEPTVIPTSTQDAGVALVERVIAEEENLQTGHLEATAEMGQRVDTASITFDLGGPYGPPRMHFVSSSASEGSVRTTELLSVGDRFWERIDGGEWIEVAAREGVWGQVRGYLPGLGAVDDSTGITAGDGVLSWRDTDRDLDLELEVDEVSGIPQRLRRTSRSNGAVVVVAYSKWNETVNINAPGQ